MKHTRERVPKGLSDKAAESGESDIEELEPKVGEELCRSWDVGQAGPSVRTPTSTNKTNRRGKPSVPTQPDRHPYPSQWEATQANVGNPAIQQVYTAHTPSIPVPVPIPSACHAIPAHYPRHQVVSAQPMAVHTHAAVPFGAHAVALQSQFRSAAPR
ncbi:unnamed protein product, partial [Porites lobata]